LRRHDGALDAPAERYNQNKAASWPPQSKEAMVTLREGGKEPSAEFSKRNDSHWWKGNKDIA
jgi:hypothetical protein